MDPIADLTHPIHTGMPAWHELGGRFGLAKTHVLTWDDYEETGFLRTHGRIPRLFRTCLVVMSDNGGTHVDATTHFNPLGEFIDEVPLERFLGRGVVLDLTHLRPVRYDTAAGKVIETDWITPEELGKACDRAGMALRPGDVVLMRTGGAAKWPRPEYALHVVPIRLDGLDWLLDRGVILFGFDQITIDLIPGYDLPHRHMRVRYSMHMENLAALETQRPGAFTFVGLPMKWERGVCSPIRALALPADALPARPSLWDLSHPILREPSRASAARFGRSLVASWSSIWETRLVENKLLVFSDHASTHIDAPSHFDPEGRTIDRLPPDWVVNRDAVLLDVSGDAGPITPDELVRAAAACDVRVGEGDIVLLYTGACRHWGTPGYLPATRPVDPDGVRWLLDRGVRVFGVDQEDIDTDVTTWPAHRLMVGREFYVIENLNLWPAVLDLPPRFRFMAAPLALAGATAAPVRAVAILPSSRPESKVR
jgi:kynurenine formamidase